MNEMEPASTIQLMLFIPSVDRDSKHINQILWKDEVLEWLGQAFGGATAFPRGRGVWRDDERGGQLVFDDTVVIISFVSAASLEAKVKDLRTFLIQMGHQTNQGPWLTL